MKNQVYSGWDQDKASIGSGNLGNLLNNYGFGGISGFGMIFVQAAQYALLVQDLNTAQNYFDTNKKDFQFFTSTYEGRMAASLSEAMSRPLYESGTFLPQYGKLDYLAVLGRGLSMGARKVDRDWYLTRRRMGRYNIGMGKWIDYKFTIEKIQQGLQGWNIGFRYEDNRKEAYDEQRHAHRINILNLGIGVGNMARNGLATSVRALSEARQQTAGQFGAFANDIGSGAGYSSTKKAYQKSQASQLATQTDSMYQTAASQPPSLGADINTKVGPQ